MALGATAFRQVQEMIKEKARQAMDTIGEEVSGREGMIRQALLKSMGYEQDSYELNSALQRLERDMSIIQRDFVEDDEVTDVIEAELQTVKDDIEAEIETARVQLNIAIDRLRNQFAIDEGRIKATREERTRDINRRKAERRIEIFEANRPGLLGEAITLKQKLDAVRKVEREIAGEVTERSEHINHARSRLQALVRGASSRAQERLLSCETMADAAVLLKEIPDINTILAMADDQQDGIKNLAKQLGASANLQIAPPPTHAPVTDDEAVTIDGFVNQTPTSVDSPAITVVEVE
jgi:hypothetical protein